MQYWVGITDGDWFDMLRRERPDEVNFWQPSWKAPRSMEAGWPFLFKLHSPRNYVVGGGYFVRFTVMSSLLAWRAFGRKNGVAGMDELVGRIEKYRQRPQRSADLIGCNLLTEPFFFDEKDWIPIPSDWSPNIVRGRTYDTDSRLGNTLWRAVQERLSAQSILDEAQTPRFGREFLIRAKLGQGTFRTLVTDAYDGRCAVSGERSLSVLDAAHIRSHESGGPNLTPNGMLLRADIHRLFDDGYVTVTPEMRFEVSPSLRDDFGNGRVYYDFDGRELASVPARPSDRPSREYLEWHHEEVYVG